MTEQSTGVSRRRVIQGAAWATPAILIASTAPAVAATGDPAIAVLGTPSATATHPSGSGNRHLTASVSFTNGADARSDDLENFFFIVDLPSGWGAPTASGWSRTGPLQAGDVGFVANRISYRFTQGSAVSPGDTVSITIAAVHTASGSITGNTVGFQAGGTSTNAVPSNILTARSTASYNGV